MSNCRFYLDHNATTPYAYNVVEWLRQKELPWGNPSSHHTSGKQAKRSIHEVEEFLLDFFSLSDSHTLFFHSGATEGLNCLIQGFFASGKEQGKNLFYSSPTDHSAIREQIPLLEKRYGVESLLFPVEEGTLDLNISTQGGLCNWTWVNNETGIVWPLSHAVALKEKDPHLFIHVDAVQSVSRIENYQKLSPEIDYYTFSGHKFGALKGIGFSFVRKGAPFTPLMLGGGQQQGFRSGTENLLGIMSLKLALEEVKNSFCYQELLQGKLWWEGELKKLLGKQGRILGESASLRNGNTTSLLFYPQKSDILLAAFDLEGIEVGRGAACSLGQTTANPVLLAMGCSLEESKKVIRFSFSPFWKKADFEALFPKIQKVLVRFF